jgi:outer membrane receptor protein involved in Fe transport
MLIKLCLLILLFLPICLRAQQVKIGGTVKSASGESLYGVSILVKGSTLGTLTDSTGQFSLSISKPLPFKLLVSYVGFVPAEIDVTEESGKINVELQESNPLGEIVVFAASRVEERILEAPVTIEKIDVKELRNTPVFDAYSTINNLKGVQANTGSLTFTSVNTRGFADMQNFRFVQLIDGMDANTPGLGYPIGGASGPADIDIASIELVPGASSALYGANTFNGLLTINTKNPFEYPGLSAYLKTGVTSQHAGGTHPINEVGFRYAKAFNNKFAFKVNFGCMRATDWTADDESFYINITRAANPIPFLTKPRNDPNFDAVSVYGDEVIAPVRLTGAATTTPVNRTGIKEKDIVDYRANTVKGNASLHYKITDKIEASYGYTYIINDAILRHTTTYPLKKFSQQFHRLELKGANWNVKAYNSKENVGDSYAMLVTGSFIEQHRKTNTAWGTDYGAAYRGEVPGLAAGNHDVARVYADRDLIPIGSDSFNILRKTTLTNTDITKGGSKLDDNSHLASVEGNYTFTSIRKVADLQIGGVFRRYFLNSNGHLFNDGPMGFNAPIPYNEYGFYAQAGKKFADDRINLRGSLRYDKNENFKTTFTPRISVVGSLDKKNNQNLRMSYQTGFRNPGGQEGYIAVDVGSAILLGGLQDNYDHYVYQDAAGNKFRGVDLQRTLVTLASYQAFAGGGSVDSSLLRLANLPSLKQEQNTTWEIGYKGLFANRLFVDLNYYHTQYQDLVVRITTFSVEAKRPFAVYTNIADKVTSHGFGAGLDYLIGKGFKVGFSYTNTTFDATVALKNNPGFLPTFNTPKNRYNASFSNDNIAKTNFGFNVKYRYWDTYTWQSPFGTGTIVSKGIVDLALSYRIRKMQSVLKLGASNLFNNEYNTVYGGPKVGSIYYFGWTFDQAFRK